MRDEANERRRYFRIDDHLYLEVRIIPQAQYEKVRNQPLQESEEVCDLILQLRALTSQAGIILSGIRKTQPEIAHYLALQDKKIDLVAQAAVGKQMDKELAPNARVNLSAGGLAYSATQEVSPKTPLLVRMVFFPSHLCIQAYGEVIHCERDDADPEKPFKVGVEFTAISEAARDALVRHTLELQSAELRHRRGR